MYILQYSVYFSGCTVFCIFCIEMSIGSYLGNKDNQKQFHYSLSSALSPRWNWNCVSEPKNVSCGDIFGQYSPCGVSVQAPP